MDDVPTGTAHGTMKLVLYTHPAYLGLRSQGHFATMLSQSYRERGHQVDLRSPADPLHRRMPRGFAAKWAGYADQYLIFPQVLKRQLRSDPPETLYVLCDQALGPWVPFLAHRPHVVHCHDLLALRSALGEWPENTPSATGRLYQRYIRRGFSQARHFISISNATRTDLHRLGNVKPLTSEVVYNGLNHPFARLPEAQARQVLADGNVNIPSRPFLLHIGGGQWYKNTLGVLSLYKHYVRAAQRDGAPVAPLMVVGPTFTGSAALLAEGLAEPAAVHRVQGLSSLQLQALYSLALAFLFPSLAEGFGWPVAEALACGCPVLTTGEAPMSEVGGDVAEYLPRLRGSGDLQDWSEHGARILLRLLLEPPAQQQARARAARARAQLFSARAAIDRYLQIYEQVLLAELNPERKHANAV